MFFTTNVEGLLRSRKKFEEILETCSRKDYIDFCRANPQLIYEIALNKGGWKTNGYKFIDFGSFKSLFDEIKRLAGSINPNSDIFKSIRKPSIMDPLYKEIYDFGSKELQGFMEFNGFPPNNRLSRNAGSFNLLNMGRSSNGQLSTQDNSTLKMGGKKKKRVTKKVTKKITKKVSKKVTKKKK